MSTGDNTKLSPTIRDTTYSFSLNDNVTFSEMDMSVTVDEDMESPTKTSTNVKESITDISKLTDLSLNEGAIVEMEAEGSLIQSETLSDTNQNIDLNTTYQVQRPLMDKDLFQISLIELGRRLWDSSLEIQHYTKGCLWSPDGTCILTAVHLDGMHVIELPNDLYYTSLTQTIPPKRKVSILNSAVHVKEGGTVYDYVWYPFMNSNTPETCCWLASRQHEPIHMWDAFTGELRCTYRGYDNVDEVESAIAITFSNDGDKIIGGYKKSIKIFDTNVPGRDLSSIAVKQAISCFALTTDNDRTVTTGSWNGFINHYDLRAPKLGPLFSLGGHIGGITWIRYAVLSDSDSWTLFSGARKDNSILEWDMRNYTNPVREFTRNVSTNQRIFFDISPHEKRWLVSGDTGGYVFIWDLQNNEEEALKIHGDCCNGVNFHPSLPILATSSGQHHFVDTSESEKSPKNNNVAQNEDITVEYENTLRLWWIGKSPVDEEVN